MSYNTKYQGSFTNTKNETYTVYILQNGYIGSIIPITLSTIPVKLNWQTDDPHAPIKGASLVVNLLNPGNLPITDFYSNSDTEFMVWFYMGATPIFLGYLVQDDCSELMVDFVHQISLSFSDNLGLLKDIPLDQNIPDFGGFLCTAYFDFVSILLTNNCFIYLYNTDFIPQVGVPFTISGHIESSVNISWTPTSVTNLLGGNWKVQVADNSFIDIEAWACFIAGSSTINLHNRNTLLNIIKVCLHNTGLQLDVYIYANLFEETHNTDRSFLEQTYIDTKTFIDGNVFKDCYTVLEEILKRFRLVLFQSNGVWVIIRWDELRYYPGTFDLPFFIYNSAFEYYTTSTMNNLFVTGFQQIIYPETGLTRSIQRPLIYDKEIFNYKQNQTILNADLQILGTLVSSSSTGGITTTLYEFPESSKWRHLYEGNAKVDISKIAVAVDDITGREVDRYVLQPKTSVFGTDQNNFACVEFNDVQVSAGDSFDFSISKKGASSTGGDRLIFVFGLYVTATGTDYWQLETDGSKYYWTYYNTPPIDALITSFVDFMEPDDAENYAPTTLSAFHPEKRNPVFPIDGVFRVRIMGSNNGAAGHNPNVDAIWKDLSVTISQNINDSTIINGHSHKSSQNANIKNADEMDLVIDDSPRSSIGGTLYKVGVTVLVWLRTENWYRITNPTEKLRIGEITTLERMKWKQFPRTKLEGTFYGLIDSKHISLLAILSNTAIPGSYFIFGSLEIDFRNNSFTGTQYEIYGYNDELPGSLSIDYEFKYLYGNQ